MPCINSKVNEKFSKRIDEIIRMRKHFPGSFDNLWDMECGALKDTIASIYDVNDYDRIVCEVIKDTVLVKTWFKKHTNTI